MSAFLKSIFTIFSNLKHKKHATYKIIYSLKQKLLG